MVMRTVIGKSGEEKVVDLIKELQARASASNTTPAGNKVLEMGEDFYWSRIDGTEHSMREVDEGLEDAKLRIEEAEAELIQTGERLDTAEQTVEEVRGELDGIDWDNLGSSDVHTSGPPPANPTIGKALWVSPTGRVFRAVECEEHA